jgi:hypothetical protein
MSHPRRVAALVVLAAALAPTAPASPPEIPQAISYEGLLLDGMGQPRTGPVDLTIRIYDELLAGTLLYKQVFSAVPLADGVFSLSLGPTGASGDTPTPPLTTSLATALAGDLVSIGPDRFVEVTVNAEPALPRSQVLSVPFALRADKAGTATAAETAAIALDVASVNGLPALVVSEMYEHFNFDGGGPPNTDPREGFGDVDGDGIANFVDADNDGDFLGDLQEVQQTDSDMNLVTPVLTGLSPSSGLANSIFSVEIQGTSFQPGMSVQFGAQSPAPFDVTPTSAQVTVGPQPAGQVSVQVTLPNGEDAPTPRSFAFAAPAFDVTDHLTFDVQDTANYAIGGADAYSSGAATFPFSSEEHLAVAWNPSGRVATLRCADLGDDDCEVRIGQDADGDFLIEPGEETPVQTLTGLAVLPARIRHARLAFDPAGNPVASYTRFPNAEVVVARDTNTDGDYADAGEIRLVAAILGGDPSGQGDLALDASGRVALLYHHPVSQRVKLAWDRNGDGDFGDTIGGNPEHVSLTNLSLFQCGGISFDSSGRLALVFAATNGLTLARDLNADGDFKDAGEVTVIAAATTGCDVEGHPSGLAVTHDLNGLHLLVDRNGDDDFADTDEQVLLAPSGSGPFAPIALGRPASGTSAVATRNTVYQDPTP